MFWTLITSGEHYYPITDCLLYAAVNIYWDNGEIPSNEPICFAEYNPEKPERQRLCIGAYCLEDDETTYYAPYVTAERNDNE